MHNSPWLLCIFPLDLYFRKNVICISLNENKTRSCTWKRFATPSSTDIASTLNKEQCESAPKQHLRCPHQTYNFLKPTLMLGEMLITNTCVRLHTGTTIIFCVSTYEMLNPLTPSIVYTKSTISFKNDYSGRERKGLSSSRAQLHFRYVSDHAVPFLMRIIKHLYSAQ